MTKAETLREEFEALRLDLSTRAKVARLKAIAGELREMAGCLSLRVEVVQILVEYQNLDIISTHHDLGYTPEEMLEEEQALKEELASLRGE